MTYNNEDSDWFIFPGGLLKRHTMKPVKTNIGRAIRAVGARQRTVTGRWSPGYGSRHVCKRHAAH